MTLEVKETNDAKHPWGLFIDGQLWGWSKHHFDCDFAKHFIENKGLDAYIKLCQENA